MRNPPASVRTRLDIPPGAVLAITQIPTPFFLRPIMDHGKLNNHRRGLVEGLLPNTSHAVFAAAWHGRSHHVSILGDWWT